MSPGFPRWVLLPLAVLQPFRIAGLPVVLLTLAVLGAVGIGGLWPSPALQLVAEDCPQPCWQGFVPGESLREDVVAAIEGQKLANPDTLVMSVASPVSQRVRLEWETRSRPVFDVQMRFTRDVLDRIELYPQDDLQLRELLGVFGSPSHVVCQNGFQVLTVQLYFSDGALAVWASQARRDQAAGDWQVSPEMQVTRLDYAVLPEPVRGLPPAAFPWRGFVRANDKGLCF